MRQFFYLVKKIFSITKKVFIVVAVYFVIVSLFMYFINKDRPKITFDPIQKNREEIYKVINDKTLNATKEGRLTVTIYRAMTCGFIGEACSNNPDDGDKNYNHSVLGFMGNLIVLPYANPPASGVYWAYSGLQNAGFIPQTYAAEGIGFAALRPFMNLWKVFRDISYMFLVIVLIAIGFMIMFRMKLNPQTVISVESALPKVVVSLILITFSFAIAGFLVDLMYVIIVLSLSVLEKSSVYQVDIAEFKKNILTSNGWSLFGKVAGRADIWNAGPVILEILPQTLRWVLQGLFGAIVSFIITSKISPVDKLATGEAVEGVVETGKIVGALIKPLFWVVFLVLSFLLAPLVLSLLVFITAIFVFFRIFFLLIYNYIQTLLLIIFSPLIMLFEAIPGKSSFSFWLKNVFANLLVFPLVAILITIAAILTHIPPGAGELWRPPFLYDINAGSFSILIGLGILFMIPDFIKTVKEALGAKGLPFAFGLGTFFGGAGAAVGGALGMTGKFSSLMLAFPGLRNVLAARGGFLQKALGVRDEELAAWRVSGAQRKKLPAQSVPPEQS